MAFGLNSDPFLLKEGFLEIGSIATPNLIGTNNTDPDSYFTSNGIVGWFKQGTLDTAIARSYADFKAGTPFVLVRKDLVGKEISLSLELAQWDGDTVDLAKGVLSQLAYSITTPTTKTVNLHWLGSDEPTQSFNCYRLSTQLTDGTPTSIYLWHAKNVAEDVGIKLSGTEHATTMFKAQAFPHPSFSLFGDEAQKHYGLIVTE